MIKPSEIDHGRHLAWGMGWKEIICPWVQERDWLPPWFYKEQHSIYCLLGVNCFRIEEGRRKELGSRNGI